MLLAIGGGSGDALSGLSIADRMWLGTSEVFRDDSSSWFLDALQWAGKYLCCPLLIIAVSLGFMAAVRSGVEEEKRKAEKREKLRREAKQELEELTGASRIELQFSLLTKIYESTSGWLTVDALAAALSKNPHVIMALLPRLVDLGYLERGENGGIYKITARGGHAIIDRYERKRFPVGDFIYAAEGSTVNNRSLIQGFFNKVEGKFAEEVEKALRKIGEAVSASGNAEAAEMYAAFLEELANEKPKKPVLRVLFEGVCAAVPAVSSLTSAVAAVATLIK